MIARSDPELRDATRRRDADSVSSFEEHYVDPEPFLRWLKADYDADVIQDDMLWLSVVSGPAYMKDLPSDANRAFDNRLAVLFAARIVEASYINRGRMTKLSVHSGIVYNGPTEPSATIRGWTEATALRIQENVRRVEVVLSRMTRLHVRYGGALALHDAGDPWVAHPDETIEAPPEMTCATCGVEIYFANQQWRDKTTRRAEVLRDSTDAFGEPMKVLDHLHDPEQAGRTL